MKFKNAVNKYLRTRQFNSLANSSQKNYEFCLTAFCRMSVMGRKLGNVNLDKLSIAMCSEIYDTWELETSTSNANHNARVFSHLINHHNHHHRTVTSDSVTLALLNRRFIAHDVSHCICHTTYCTHTRLIT